MADTTITSSETGETPTSKPTSKEWSGNQMRAEGMPKEGKIAKPEATKAASELVQLSQAGKNSSEVLGFFARFRRGQETPQPHSMQEGIDKARQPSGHTRIAMRADGTYGPVKTTDLGSAMGDGNKYGDSQRRAENIKAASQPSGDTRIGMRADGTYGPIKTNQIGIAMGDGTRYGDSQRSADAIRNAQHAQRYVMDDAGNLGPVPVLSAERQPAPATKAPEVAAQAAAPAAEAAATVAPAIEASVAAEPAVTTTEQSAVRANMAQVEEAPAAPAEAVSLDADQATTPDAGEAQQVAEKRRHQRISDRAKRISEDQTLRTGNQDHDWFLAERMVDEEKAAEARGAAEAMAKLQEMAEDPKQLEEVAKVFGPLMQAMMQSESGGVAAEAAAVDVAEGVSNEAASDLVRAVGDTAEPVADASTASTSNEAATEDPAKKAQVEEQAEAVKKKIQEIQYKNPTLAILLRTLWALIWGAKASISPRQFGFR